MGSAVSKGSNYRKSVPRPSAHSQANAPPALPVAINDGPGLSDFLKPYSDTKARDDTLSFPLDTLEMSSLSDRQIALIFSTAPILHDYGVVRIVRLSKSLACKGGRGVAASEAQTMALAESFHLPVPRVHRTFVAAVPGFSGEFVTGHFIVMDYIPGPTVEQCWVSLESQQRLAVAGQVCDIINKLQSTPLKQSPGPVGRMKDQKFEGPWFTDGGAGPFETLKDLEGWYNHKIDVCIRFKQATPNTPRFVFNELVLTHQDICPRNLIVDAQGKLWMIDWGIAGLYPPGFEQAALRAQCGRYQEFLGMVLAGLPNRQDFVFAQFSTIQYGLSVAANL